MKKNTFVKGTIVGALIGAIGGLLLAPKSGKETQADIKRKVKGTYQEILDSLDSMTNEVGGKVDSLKVAAKDLKGEAKEESQELIRRAEVLKQDLRIAGTNLAKSGAKTKDSSVKQVKLLMGEGADVMKELERVTKRLAASAKDKAKDVKDAKAETDK
jgi:gas vesicle protein